MNYRTTILDIEDCQSKSFITITDFTDKKNVNLARNKRGLYWIWTSLTNDELKMASSKVLIKYEKHSHVNVPKMIEVREHLKYICTINHPINTEFRIVYNGIGGFHKSINSSGLRGRILQEFNANNPKTGTLNFGNLGLDLSKFAISYFDFDNEINKKHFDFLNELSAYANYANLLEIVWRLEFGQPILCKQ